MTYTSWYGGTRRQRETTPRGKPWRVAMVAFLAGTATGAALVIAAILFLRPSGGFRHSLKEAVRRYLQDDRQAQTSDAPRRDLVAQQPIPHTKEKPTTPPATEEPVPEPTPPAAPEPVAAAEVPAPPAKPEPPMPPAVEEPAPAPSRSGPSDPLARPVLKQADFEYLGAFALPKQAGKNTTNWCGGGLAVRRVDGKLRFLSVTGRHSGEQLYEASFPGFGKNLENNGSKLPRADVVKYWGDIYRGREDASGGDGGWVTYGLFWDEPTKRLYWSQAIYYNSKGWNTPSLGYTELKGEDPVNHGPWATDSYIQKVRGGCLRLPDYFARKYTNGRPLALGFGASYCIIAGGSFGPCLYAASEPRKEGEVLRTLPLLNFEAAPGSPDARYCRRDTDYRSTIEFDKNPVDGVGFWTAADYVTGGCCWIDLPDKHGLLVLGYMGHDRIWYGQPEGGEGDQGIHSKRSEPWWYVFNPADLAAVARRSKQPYAPIPSWWKCAETELQTTGCCFDAPTRILYVLEQNRWRDEGDVEVYPVVHGYRVK